MQTHLNELFVIQKCRVATAHNRLAVIRKDQGFHQLHLQHSNLILNLQEPIVLAILIHYH
jgi:hypothetical protein